MPKPGTRNQLYVLVNGQPDEWALARDVPVGENPDGVMVVRFDDVPDEVADQIEAEGDVSSVWGRLCEGYYKSL